MSSLTHFVVGGAALAASMMEAVDAHGITALLTWKISEISPLGPAGMEAAMRIAPEYGVTTPPRNSD